MRIPPLAGAILAMAAAPACACAQEPVTIAVFNYADVPSAEIASAVETARMAYRSAGIETVWVVCMSENCSPLTAGGRYLELMVMPRSRGPFPGGSSQLHPAGYAMSDGPFPHPRAYAFYDAARNVADRTLRPISLVLGCVFTHETAHLLGLGHQSHGVMRPNLEVVDMDNVAMGRAFNSEEVKQLRSRTGPRNPSLALACSTTRP